MVTSRVIVVDPQSFRYQLPAEHAAFLTRAAGADNFAGFAQYFPILGAIEDDILESYEEHHVADLLVAELAAMEPGDERFTAKTTVLIENVRHHMDEEENEWFPQVREHLGRKQLQQLGAQMIALRESAPRRPAQPSAFKKAIDSVIS